MQEKNYFKKIDQADNGDFKAKQKKDSNNDSKWSEDVKNEEWEKIIEEKTLIAQKFIENHAEKLALFTGDPSLKYIPSLGDSFYYLPENNEIYFDVEWFISKEYTNEEILWALYHEGSHFRDKRENPEFFLGSFNYYREKGKEIASILEQKYRTVLGEKYPEIIENFTTPRPFDKNDPKKGKITPFQAIGYKKIARFYNILDDIYGNDMIRNRASRYNTVDGREVTQNLYKKLFHSNDFSSLPRHISFDALLRREMVLDEEHILHQDFQEVFDDNYFVIKSALEKIHYLKKGQSNPEERYKIIKDILEPIYLELLKKDIEEWEPELPLEQKSEGKEGGEEGGEGKEGGDFDINPDPFKKDTPDLPGHGFGPSKAKKARDDIDDIIDEINKDIDEVKNIKKNKDKEEKEKNKSPEERRKEIQRKKEREIDNRFDISPKIRRLYNKRREQTEKYFKEMLKFFQSIIYGRSKKWEREIRITDRGKFTVKEYIKRYAENEEIIRTGKGRIKSFEKTTTKEIPTNQPEIIKVRVVGDVSGSMNIDNRMEILQKTMVLLLNAVESFNKYLDISRYQSSSKLKADSEAWAYNNDAVIIKKFNGEGKKTYQQREAEIIKSLNGILVANRENDEYVVFKKIEDSIEQNELRKIKEKKVLELVFFVTDGGLGYGGAHNIDEIQKQVKALDKKGVLIIAFQIGSDSGEEKERFDFVFNQKKLKYSQGKFIGSQIEKLPQEAITALKNILNNIRI